ncbi:hypothetical protein ACFVJ4_37540 [Streptomyces sp. NPDC127178]|uniref:hypothetical protein n=1 Tax=unclassified Streptomyces TaxID=2593676 RepID=UPI0036347D69
MDSSALFTGYDVYTKAADIFGESQQSYVLNTFTTHCLPTLKCRPARAALVGCPFPA